MADNKKTCIDCGILHCRLMEHEFPEFCPTLEMTDEFIDSAMELYEDPLNSKITIAAAEVEAEFYCQITRIEEIMEFSRKIGAKKRGIATCIGLCVGHDSLFYKYSEAPCTTLVTKDRVLGHNPAVALYQADAYYKNKLFK